MWGQGHALVVGRPEHRASVRWGQLQHLERVLIVFFLLHSEGLILSPGVQGR